MQESSDIKSFYLKPSDGAGVAGYRAGQFVTVRVPQTGAEPLIRCWSISGYDEELKYYRISVKREPLGAASRILHDTVQVGCVIDLMAPSGYFTLDRSAIAQPVVLISAGVGITPMVSMLHSHLARLDADLPTLYFIHTTKDESSHAFRLEVNELVTRSPQLHSYTIYTNPHSDSELGVDYQSKERLSKVHLDALLNDVGT